MRNKYTDEEFRLAVEESFSVRQVLSRLGLVPAGGNYATANKKIEELGLSKSHFTGQGWSKGQTKRPKRDLEDYLSNKYPTKSHRLKLRLIKEGVFERKCYSCGGVEWMGVEIPLELEHINGRHDDNSLINLTLLCPNCHALTSTYRGRNINKAV